MAKQEKKPQRVSVTLETGTKVTASQEVVDKLRGKAPSSKSSK